MEKDLDTELYNRYLNGEKETFEILYSKYKEKIRYFIYNIVNDYQKAEDITQDTFMYVLQNKMKEGCSFKFYIYLVAKSRAYNYITAEKKHNEINGQYFVEVQEKVEQDLMEIVIKNENKKELLKAIDMLDERYKNALYLVKIEELSYHEAAKILGETEQNLKNLIHRGKKDLKKILIKKGFDNMNSGLKIILLVICISILLIGGVYATVKIVNMFTGKADIVPSYTSGISTMDSNKVWVGTFNLVWNDFMNEVIKGDIEFEDGESKLANELNKQTFTTSQLSENSYFKIHGVATYDLKDTIEKAINEKFNEKSEVLEKVEWGNSDVYVLYSILKKEFNYLEKFSLLEDNSFAGSESKVKYFGINQNTNNVASKNVEVLYYNSENDFGIKLKTKENEEVILYKTTGEGKSFEENYKELLEKNNKYEGNRNFSSKDILAIPFIKVKDEINYDELCGRIIKGTNIYIRQALQTVDFELNNVGGSVKSEALIESYKQAISNIERKFIYDSDFILYLKEGDKEQPYFALKVDNAEILVGADEN